jgi:RHH-type transcriptional regulator, rel operon repressor / antitoxin RelB
MVTLRLNPATDRKLARLAKANGTTKTAIAREALTAHLEEAEDVRIAEERLKNPGKRIPLEDLERELGLAR